MMQHTNWKHLFARALKAQTPRLSFLAHGHHLWPDATHAAHLAAWDDACQLAGRKWDKVLGPVWEEAQSHVARELKLPDPSTVTFAGNAHDFVARIFSALRRKPVRILSSTNEFQSFMRQARRWVEDGTAVLTLAEPDALLERATTEPFDLIYISQVFFNTGRLSDWRALAHLATPAGPWIVVDGYHGFMAVETDLSDVAHQIFYLAGGYKHAMAGEGIGILHAPHGLAPNPTLTGWFAWSKTHDYNQNTPVPYPNNARRFLGSTFDPSGLYRFNAVRRMLAEAGLDTRATADHVHRLQRSFFARARLPGLDALNPIHSQPGAKFLAFSGSDIPAITRELAARHIDVDGRDGLLRIGFSLYHDESDVRALAQVLEAARQ